MADSVPPPESVTSNYFAGVTLRPQHDRLEAGDAELEAGELVRATWFHGIFASIRPIPQVSVTPAKTSPAPTNADNPMNAG